MSARTLEGTPTEWPAPCTEADCGASMRPGSARVTEYPGTVQHIGGGRCHRCYKRARYRDRQEAGRVDAMRRDVVCWLRSRGWPGTWPTLVDWDAA